MTAGRRILVLLLLAAGAAGVGWFLWPRTPLHEALPPLPSPDPAPADPRTTHPTPFRNVRPEVGYVGDAACAGCHPAISERYRGHPMGRSAGPVRADDTTSTPVRVGGTSLRADRDGDRVIHRMTAAGDEYAVPVQLAIGSGTRGRSYLTADPNGAVWQSPLSWFAADGGRWDLSPGYDLGGSHAGRRPVPESCLFCHVNRVEPVPGAENRYRTPVFAEPTIGCERCHGPGALHVAERATSPPAAGPDRSIVNPKHLEPPLRQAVCEQCHLQGQARVPRRGRSVFDYRPGLPLEEFVTVLVRHPELADGRRSVGQVEQMERSRCFTASAGKLGCVSCHDPHAVPAPAERAAVYRVRCLSCHADRGCAAPPAERTARRDDCVGCHMPRADSANIVHASVTDHTVPRRPKEATPGRGLPPGADPLRAFRGGLPAADAARAVGIGLAQNLHFVPAPARPAVAASAADRLASSLNVWPADVPARVARATALGEAGRDDERLADARLAARLDPRSGAALSELTDAATAAGRFDVAIDAATAWATLNPTAVQPLVDRAAARAKAGDWPGAGADVSAALTVHPLHPRGRLLAAAARHHAGDPAGGRRLAEAAVALIPRADARRAAQAWYQRATGP